MNPDRYTVLLLSICYNTDVWLCRVLYEGRSINKLQNGAIPSVLRVGKIRNIRFVGNLILNIHTTFLDDDVIIVTSSDNRKQSTQFR